MLEYLYFGGLTASILLALSDWRRGIYLCLVFDALRDPMRKMAEGKPVAITLAASALWLAVLLGASHRLGPRLLLVMRHMPSLRNATTLLLAAMLPAAMVSILNYEGGWKIASIGLFSYAVPLLGVVVGYHYLRRPDDLWPVMGFYCIFNSIVLIGALFEFLKWDVPALGGIDFVWLRHLPGRTVELICGFYRSPDLMGLHAANVAMFASMLSVRRDSRYKWLWIVLVMWGSFCLLLCGRRKMIGMLLVFGIVYVGLRLRSAGLKRVVPFAMVLLSALMMIHLLTREVVEAQEYADYAQTTITQGNQRLQVNVIGGVVGSVQQAGILGYGLGTATQGRYHAARRIYGESGQFIKAWQEDGISRVFAEMGVFGAILVLFAVVLGLKACRRALKMVPAHNRIAELQMGLAGIIAASAASFVISHQAFSGDPCSMLFVAFLLGVMLSGPIQVIREIMAYQQYEEFQQETGGRGFDPELQAAGRR
jgi:hypothetical protein